MAPSTLPESPVMADPAFVSLMYHDIQAADGGVYSLSWRSLTTHLDRLQDAGFVVEGFAGLERRVASGEWPERYAVLTFDDGYRSFLPVAELLATRGMQATFFLTRDLCQQRSDFLRDPEIRRLGELGEVGTHGTSHARLSHLPPAAASQELVESRQWLEDLLGREVRFMSVPGGFWSPSRQRLAIQAGYTLVGNSREWWNRAQLVRRWRQVNRVALRSHFSPVQFDRILRRDLRFYIPRWLRFLALAIPKSLWLRAVGPESALSRPR